MFEKILRKFGKIYFKIKKNYKNLEQLCKYSAVLKNFQYVLNECLKNIENSLRNVWKIWQNFEQNLKQFKQKI